MVYIVTGGAGFIGSNFIRYLRRQHPDCMIVCFDKMTYAADIAHLEGIMSGGYFDFVRGDICDRDTVYSVFEKYHPDYLINFAAESHVDRSINSAEQFCQSNFYGVSVLLDACVKYGIKRYHQVSTDEVYGDIPLDSPLSFTEEAPLRPGNPYSATKAGADMLVLSYRHTYGLDITISRCTNNYGPMQDTEKLIPRMISNILDNKKLPVYGTGKNIRDWIFVEDHCAAVLDIVIKGRAGGIYNVSADHPVTNLDLVRMLCDLTSYPADRIEFVPDRKGHDLKYSIDCSRLKTELGWEPKVSFDDGIRETLKWYKDNI